MYLDLGSIKLPLSSATKTFALLAKRGAGKSYAAGIMAEEFFKVGIPFVVFDPIDVWWGLRLNKDGRGKGLPIVVFGLEHADLPLEKTMGPQIAQAIIKYNISVVISTFGMSKNGYRQLVSEFADELLKINNSPRHIFIEEACEFVPQRVFGGMGRTYNSVSNLVTLGRNRGFGVTLINQRAATINKDVLTQLDTLIALRTVGPQDRKAFKDWVEFHAAEGDFDKFIKSLPSLPTGEGWIWSPHFLNVFEKIKFREKETFHPDREKMGEFLEFKVPQIEEVDLQNFIENFNKSYLQISKQKIIKNFKVPSLKMGIIPATQAEKTIPESEYYRLKNELESQILSLQMIVKVKDEIINKAKQILGSPVTGPPVNQSMSFDNNNQVVLWQSKLGQGGAGRIFKFLAEKSGLRFTKSQIGLAVGLSSNSGSFGTYISTLRSNKLILKESDLYFINPEFFT